MKLEYFEVYDELTGKCLFIEAGSMDEAITISELIDYKKHNDGDYIKL
jgi:hypothetical protein